MTESEISDEENGPEANVIEIKANERADPELLIKSSIPEDLLEKYKFASYGRAVSILSHGFPELFDEILCALREFHITTAMIRRPGGNESEIPKAMSAILRPNGWYETSIAGDLVIRRSWREFLGYSPKGKPKFKKQSDEFKRANFFDGHKIDYVKSRVAFDFEWNSKDQNFDRDLYAFDAFSTAGAIDVAVIVTRDVSLNPIFEELGTALNKDGTEKIIDGNVVPLKPKYGASTTWWGKLIYRLNAGRNGACPVLVVGITPECISDLEEWRSTHSAASAAEL
jgi:hypothetical protein